MKTNELTGKLLDHWVARAENYTLSERGDFWDLPDKTPWDGVLRFYSIKTDEWKPSANWAQGGLLVEREKIATECPRGEQWEATVWTKDSARRFVTATGDTLLVAAMRCYVMSKFGDEVPDETGSAA